MRSVAFGVDGLRRTHDAIESLTIDLVNGGAEPVGVVDDLGDQEIFLLGLDVLSFFLLVDAFHCSDLLVVSMLHWSMSMTFSST